MSEQMRPRSREAAGPGDSGRSDERDPLAHLAYVIGPGGRRETLPVAGLTVGEIRRRLADRLNVDSTAQAMIGTTDVTDDRVLLTGEHLFFRRPAGEKGSRPGRIGLRFARRR